METNLTEEEEIVAEEASEPCWSCGKVDCTCDADYREMKDDNL